MLKTLMLLLLVTSAPACFAAGVTNAAAMDDWVNARENSGFMPVLRETNIIAVSEWSKPVRGIRARMLLGHEYHYPYSESRLYVELYHALNSKSPIELSFDPATNFHCKLVDAKGNPAPQVGGGVSGNSELPACVVTLPFESTIRLRVNPFADTKTLGGAPDQGDFLTVYLPNSAWIGIRAGDTNVYYLSGTLTIARETLELPRMEVSLKRR